MVGHGGSSAGSYLADPTSPIPSHCASIVVTSTVRVKAGTIQQGVTSKVREVSLYFHNTAYSINIPLCMPEEKALNF